MSPGRARDHAANMRLSNAITRMPRPFTKGHLGDFQQAVPWASGDIFDLLQGTAGSSPYLHGLIVKEAEWLESALDDLDGALPSVFAALREGPVDKRAADLRIAKRRVALLTALADLSGAWQLEQVTGALSDFADLAVQLAIEATVGAEIRRGKIPGATEDDIGVGAGLVALAMGKMGAGELNYSSDIDLICLFDETRFDRDDFLDARAGLIKATRNMSKMLNDLTAEGYVFRTDLRLRPDPAVTPVCVSMDAAEHYYESLGRTWERAAYIKARAAAGDIKAGEQFLNTIRPFVWRRHLDFAAIQDAHDMRLKIREHKGLGGPITLDGHNMKLGRGGIREIEFFTQTRQLISGGRDPDLRVRGTVDGLRVLTAKGWVPQDASDKLIEHYRAHREVEHRVQMIQDAQTHDLPRSPDGFERLAALSGLNVDDMKRDISQRLEEVHALTESFFAPDATAAKPDEDEDTFGEKLIARWPSYPAMRSSRATEIFERLRPDIVRRLKASARPDEALVAFDGFLAGLPAGVQLFSLFEANPQLVDLLIDIVTMSPELARYLSQNSRVFDAVLGGDFFAPWAGVEKLTADLAEALESEKDYERKLDASRRHGKEWHFRIGVHLLRGLITATEAAAQYAELAEATLASLWPIVVAEFARKYGPPPGKGAAVIGMGSLGAGQMHARSDLDVIVIYDADGAEMSDGPKSLSVRPYYARLTQALVTAVTAPMSEGRIYEIDMRLRPSGNQGPVATSLTSFKDYQQNQAWLWEHLALTRARAVAGEVALGQEVMAFRDELLSQPQDRAKVLKEVSDMRDRIAQAKGDGGIWDFKIGRGKMQEIELLSQAGALLCTGAPPANVALSLKSAAECGWLDPDTSQHLAETYKKLWALQCGAKLLSGEQIDPEQIAESSAQFLCRLAGASDFQELEATLRVAVETAAQMIDQSLQAAEG